MPTFLTLFAPGHDNRSRLTCRLKCGDACFHEVPNTSENEYLGDIIASAVSRRSLFRAAAVVGVAGAAGLAIDAVTGTTASAIPPAPGTDWTAIKPSNADAVVVPDGFDQNVVMRWGDRLFSSVPEFDPMKQTAKAQAGQFGYNCDFLGFFDLDADTEVMMVNHEYTDEYIMYPNYDPTAPTREQVEIAWAAHGLSVVAVKKEKGTGRLTPIVDHKLNRRFTATSEFTFTGPAAGSAHLRTASDPSGMTARGTLNNCSGGLTPWGTWLTAEENFNQYFANSGTAQVDDLMKASFKRYGIPTGTTERQWEKFDDRFDLAKDPNELNTFGWIVEIDPMDPTSTPRKRTALGRFKHEAGTCRTTKDGRVAVYSGDDERFDYLYKFVSDATPKGKGLATGDVLDKGTLYVAKFTGNSPASEIDGSGKLPSDGHFDGTGEWIKLVHGDESFVDGMTAAEVLVFTRLAADKVGATKMDRPEDVEPNPRTGKVYMALTNNSKRTAEQVEEANPRPSNKHGHVLELTEQGDDAGATSFTWTLLLVCGDPNDASTYFGGFDKSQVSPISCPDNVCFDEYGNLWISTDGNQLGAHDGLYAVPLEGATRGKVQQFLSVPTGAETCGPWVTPERVNVAVQHPGETDGASFEKPSSHWPDGGTSLPRPSVVSVWRRQATPSSPAPSSPAPSQQPTSDPIVTPTPTRPTPGPGLPKTGN